MIERHSDLSPAMECESLSTTIVSAPTNSAEFHLDADDHDVCQLYDCNFSALSPVSFFDTDCEVTSTSLPSFQPSSGGPAPVSPKDKECDMLSTLPRSRPLVSGPAHSSPYDEECDKVSTSLPNSQLPDCGPALKSPKDKECEMLSICLTRSLPLVGGPAPRLLMAHEDQYFSHLECESMPSSLPRSLPLSACPSPLHLNVKEDQLFSGMETETSTTSLPRTQPLSGGHAPTSPKDKECDTTAPQQHEKEPCTIEAVYLPPDRKTTDKSMESDTKMSTSLPSFQPLVNGPALLSPKDKECEMLSATMPRSQPLLSGLEAASNATCEAPAVAEPPGTMAQLVAEVKALKRSGGQFSWNAFLKSQGHQSKDPKRHHPELLIAFIDHINAQPAQSLDGSMQFYSFGSRLPSLTPSTKGEIGRHFASIRDSDFIAAYEKFHWHRRPPDAVADRYFKLFDWSRCGPTSIENTSLQSASSSSSTSTLSCAGFSCKGSSDNN